MKLHHRCVTENVHKSNSKESLACYNTEENNMDSMGETQWKALCARQSTSVERQWNHAGSVWRLQKWSHWYREIYTTLGKIAKEMSY